MSIENDLDTELKDAMKARDRARLDVIRQIRTDVAQKLAEPGFSGMADDDLYRSVIGSYTKKMAKAREEFLAAGDRGVEQAGKLAFEIDYLQRWLPQLLSEEETRRVVKAKIEELGVGDPQKAGMVVGAVMKSDIEGLDGATVNRLVREELGAT